MRYFLICFCLFICSTSWSQSKKKQITSLSHKNDSLQLVIQSLENYSKKDSIQLIELKDSLEFEKSRYAELAKKTDYLDQRRLRNISRLEKQVKSLEKQLPERKKATKQKATKPANSPFGNGGGFGSGGTNQSGGCFGVDNGTSQRNHTTSNLSKSQKQNQRIRLNNVNLTGLEIEKEGTIAFKLILAPNGSIIKIIVIKTTITNIELADKMKKTVKEQVKYNKVDYTTIDRCFYTVKFNAQ